MSKLTKLLTFRNLTLLLCILAMSGSFLFPVCSARDRLEEAFVVTVKWINLPEFSGWGGIAAALPVLLAALICSGLDVRRQRIGWLLLNGLGAYAIPAALLAVRTELAEQIGIVTQMSGLSMFLPLLIAASVAGLFALTDTNGCTEIENKV